MALTVTHISDCRNRRRFWQEVWAARPHSVGQGFADGTAALPAKTLPNICCRPSTEELPPIPWPDENSAALGDDGPPDQSGRYVPTE
jgi:hypothetical protein